MLEPKATQQLIEFFMQFFEFKISLCEHPTQVFKLLEGCLCRAKVCDCWRQPWLLRTRGRQAANAWQHRRGLDEISCLGCSGIIATCNIKRTCMDKLAGDEDKLGGDSVTRKTVVGLSCVIAVRAHSNR